MRECIVFRAFRYAQTHTAYRSGHTGPEYFDCTGLVYRVFADCDATNVIGAQGEQPVLHYYEWFSARGQADSLPPQKGDLVVYGPQYAHIAIYVGEGRAISTLLDGVRVHDTAGLGSIDPDERMSVEAYLHIRPD